MVKDELKVFLGNHPQFREIKDYLPTQRSKMLDGIHLELKQHQREASDTLQATQNQNETIALLSTTLPAPEKTSPLRWTPNAAEGGCFF